MRKGLLAGSASLGGARLLLVAAALVATAAWLAVGSAAAGRTRASRQVVFYADVANTVPGSSFSKNVPTVRPNTVLLIQDGSSILEKLHWSSWGGSVARATGILSASNCMSNCAAGRRTHDPAQFVVSHRRHLFGRTVYSCYQLTDPKAPQTYNDCLKHLQGNQYYYAPVAGSALHLSGFLSPDRKIWCYLGSGATVCYSGGPPSAAISNEYSATLHANGQLATCAWHAGQSQFAVCYQNWNAVPAVRSGQVDMLFQFRCQAASAAITCKVDTGTGKGKGFTISGTGVTPIP